MHAILFPVGSSGDVHPMIGLGLSLKSRGHDVTICTSGYFEDLTKRVGLRFVELGTKDEFVRLADNPDLWHPFRSFGYVFRHGIDQVMRRQYEIIESNFDKRHTVIVGSCLGFGARIAQEKLGVPLVTIHLQPAVLWSEFQSPKIPGIASTAPRLLKRLQFWLGEILIVDRIACKNTNAFRESLGLVPMKRAARWWHSTECIIGLFPKWYAPYQPDWPDNLHLTDFPLWDEREVAELPESVKRFLEVGKPPIVFTPGSAMLFGRNFFETAVETCAKLERRGILLTRFPNQLPGRLPDHVIHAEYVPFSLLLRHADALVHHGGIGTTSQALAAGIPQLIMPMAHDQPDNAARIGRLGVGDSVRPSSFRASVVARKLRRLLNEPRIRVSCRHVAERFQGHRGLGDACDIIERYANSRISSGA